MKPDLGFQGKVRGPQGASEALGPEGTHPVPCADGTVGMPCLPFHQPAGTRLPLDAGRNSAPCADTRCSVPSALRGACERGERIPGITGDEVQVGNKSSHTWSFRVFSLLFSSRAIVSPWPHAMEYHFSFETNPQPHSCQKTGNSMLDYLVCF